MTRMMQNQWISINFRYLEFLLITALGYIRIWLLDIRALEEDHVFVAARGAAEQAREGMINAFD
jgi:hypothetical protein